MPGQLINGIKYIYLCNSNDLKKKSLEDNLYFTLRDIFLNSTSYDTCTEANTYNRMLSDGVAYEERTEKFRYTNVLYQKDSIDKYLTWLNRITPTWFEFLELEHGEEINEEEYMKFDDWWVQFEELRNLIRQQRQKLELYEENLSRVY